MNDDQYAEYRREAYRQMREQMPEVDEVLREMIRQGFDPQGAIVLPKARAEE